MHGSAKGYRRPGTARPPETGDAHAPEEDLQDRRGDRMVRTALLIAVGLILLLLAGAAGGLLYLQGRLDANLERFADPFTELPERPPAPADDGTATPAQPVTFLVLGSDSRISVGDPDQWTLGAQRTDAIMLVQLSGSRDALTVMSLPRDAWVTIPGRGDHKLNAAFSFGGLPLTVHTVETLTGVHIDHVAVADFHSFAALTDELGGVEITLEQPLTHGPTTLPPGTHRLDGDQALQYVRERYTVPGGDFGRMQRQQNWMRAILGAMLSRDVVTDPQRLWGVLETISRSVAVDEALTIGELRDLALSARDLRRSGLTFITAPHRGVGWSPDGRQSIVVLDDAPFAEVTGAFADGTIDRFLDQHPDIAARLGSVVD